MWRNNSKKWSLSQQRSNDDFFISWHYDSQMTVTSWIYCDLLFSHASQDRNKITTFVTLHKRKILTAQWLIFYVTWCRVGKRSCIWVKVLSHFSHIRIMVLLGMYCLIIDATYFLICHSLAHRQSYSTSSETWHKNDTNYAYSMAVFCKCLILFYKKKM